uniref:Uncharacterized protein n=1 Tax=Ditylenchus dipsaci TaxID=166011 RepID=A0A915DYR1_9BILA
MEVLMKKCIKDLTIRPSITLDLWTDESYKHAYLGVTLHFVRRSRLERMFFGLREMDKDHTAENILTATEELLGKFDLSLDRIFKIVTDNGSNVVAAFKDIQIIDFNTEYVDDDDDDEDYDEGNLSNIPDESILLEAFPQRISCFAHSLQLVILKFFKDDVIFFSGYKKMMDVVKKVKISPKLKKELHKRCGATVKLPSTTRWGSLIEVIRQFLEVKQSLGEIQSLKTLMPQQRKYMLVHRVGLKETDWKYTIFVYDRYTVLATNELCIRQNQTYYSFLRGFGLFALPKVRKEKIVLGNKINEKPVSVELYQGEPKHESNSTRRAYQWVNATSVFIPPLPYLATAFTQPEQGLVYGWQAYFQTSEKSNIHWMEFWFPNMTSVIPDAAFLILNMLILVGSNKVQELLLKILFVLALQLSLKMTSNRGGRASKDPANLTSTTGSGNRYPGLFFNQPNQNFAASMPATQNLNQSLTPGGQLNRNRQLRDQFSSSNQAFQPTQQLYTAEEVATLMKMTRNSTSFSNSAFTGIRKTSEASEEFAVPNFNQDRPVFAEEPALEAITILGDRAPHEHETVLTQIFYQDLPVVAIEGGPGTGKTRLLCLTLQGLTSLYKDHTRMLVLLPSDKSFVRFREELDTCLTDKLFSDLRPHRILAIEPRTLTSERDYDPKHNLGVFRNVQRLITRHKDRLDMKVLNDQTLEQFNQFIKLVSTLPPEI